MFINIDCCMGTLSTKKVSLREKVRNDMNYEWIARAPI